MSGVSGLRRFHPSCFVDYSTGSILVCRAPWHIPKTLASPASWVSITIHTSLTRLMQQLLGASMPRLADHTLGHLRGRVHSPLPPASFSTLKPEPCRTTWPTLPSSGDLLGLESGSVLELNLHKLLLAVAH